MENKLNSIIKELEKEYDETHKDFSMAKTNSDRAYINGQEMGLLQAIAIVKNFINEDEEQDFDDFDDFDDSVDETNYDPYSGCDSWDY